jgi:hypothetical protein
MLYAMTTNGARKGEMGGPAIKDAQGFLVFAVILYGIDLFASPALRYLANLSSAEDVVMHIKKRRDTPPSLGFTCECSHTETRKRYVTEYYTEYEWRYDGTANASRSVPVSKTRQREETYQEQVVTYRGSCAFVYSRWVDVSAALTDEIYNYEAVRIDLSFGVGYGDRRTAEAYAAARSRFIEQNRNRDTSFRYWEHCTLDGFRPKLLSIVDLSKRSPLMSVWAYLLLGAFGLSWPYRLWFNRQTVGGSYRLEKRVFV